MAEITKFTPLWGVWDITRQLGSGTFGDVYEAKRRDTGREYLSAIKHISIPPKNTSIEALAAEGTVTDAVSAQQYCQGLLDTLVKEIDICYELKGYTNFVSYEDHLIIPRQGEIGYDIFIRMELLTALHTHISRNGITVGEITKLCEDMCTALSVLESKNIIHRDIKPANIFINSAGEYKLGDFGVARHMEGLGSMSVKGTYNYMAAEILKGGVVGSNSDLYSLGLVLYRLLNNNRAPFLPPPPVIVGYEEEQRALDRRLQGEPLPPPDRAELSLPLTNVVMRAVEYDPARRYRSASEMKQALTDFKRSQGTPAQGIDLDATVALDRAPQQLIQQGSSGSWVKKEPGSSVGFGNAPTPPGEKSNKTMFAIIFSAIGVLAVLLTVILVFVLPGNNSGDSGSMTQAPEKAAVKPVENSPQTPEPSPTPSPAIDIGMINSVITSYTHESNVSVGIVDLYSGEIYTTDNGNSRFVSSGFYMPVYVALDSAAGYSSYISNIMKNKDNASANYIIEDIGGCAAVNEILRQKGYTDTTMGRLFGDTQASNNGFENYTSAYEAAEMLQYIYNDGIYTQMYTDLSEQGISTPVADHIYAHSGQGIGTSFNVFLIIENSVTKYGVVILTQDTGSTWERAKENAAPIITSLLNNIDTQMRVYWQ